jgi:hypothetical protein
MSERIDDERGAVILFEAVRGSIRAAGGDTTEAPFDRLDEPSRAVWVAAWRALVAEMIRREYVFAHYLTLRRMVDAGEFATAWRTLESRGERAAD